MIYFAGVQDGPGGMLAGFNPNGGNIASTLGELYMLTAGLHKNAGLYRNQRTIGLICLILHCDNGI